jgi:NAD(P)-dependent dehydrogenase (short-subunit alcohol dehydrogenase family)
VGEEVEGDGRSATWNSTLDVGASSATQTTSRHGDGKPDTGKETGVRRPLLDRQMTVNARGAFLTATAAARQMLRQGDGGRIIINASGAGKMAPGKEAPLGVYAMTKHAVVGLTRQLGVELAGDGILVNCICGGIVDTEMWNVIDRGVTGRSGAEAGSFKAEAVASVPIGRIQRPEDMANVAVYLAGNEADYIAGQTLNVSGGRLPY